MPDDETFTAEEVAKAIRQFLELGEATNPRGYFGRGGWAGRVLRWHLQQLSQETSQPADDVKRLKEERDAFRDELRFHNDVYRWTDDGIREIRIEMTADEVARQETE